MSWRSLLPSSSWCLQSENSGLHTLWIWREQALPKCWKIIFQLAPCYIRRLESSSMLLWEPQITHIQLIYRKDKLYIYILICSIFHALIRFIIYVGTPHISRNGPFHTAALPPLSAQHTTPSTKPNNLLQRQAVRDCNLLQYSMSSTSQPVVIHLNTPTSSADKPIAQQEHWTKAGLSRLQTAFYCLSERSKHH
jgi:hypothetical protein